MIISPDSGSATESGISAPTLEAEPSISPNEIQPDAEREFRAALVKSQESAAESGLTELWFDTDGVIVCVIDGERLGLYVLVIVGERVGLDVGERVGKRVVENLYR